MDRVIEHLFKLIGEGAPEGKMAAAFLIAVFLFLLGLCFLFFNFLYKIIKVYIEKRFAKKGEDSLFQSILNISNRIGEMSDNYTQTYLTKTEFKDFKDSIKEDFKDFKDDFKDHVKEFKKNG